MAPVDLVRISTATWKFHSVRYRMESRFARHCAGISKRATQLNTSPNFITYWRKIKYSSPESPSHLHYLLFFIPHLLPASYASRKIANYMLQVKSLFCLLLLISIVLSGYAQAQPVVVTMPDPHVTYTPEEPACLYFKEIAVTRVSQRKIDVELTLRGDLQIKMPHGRGLCYRIFFDVDGVSKSSPLYNNNGFVEDQYVNIFRDPGSSGFGVSMDYPLNYRSKVWDMSAPSLRANKDKITLSVISDFFSEPNVKIRVLVQSLASKTVDRVSSSGKKIAVDSILTSPIFDLPEKKTEKKDSSDPFAR